MNDCLLNLYFVINFYRSFFHVRNNVKVCKINIEYEGIENVDLNKYKAMIDKLKNLTLLLVAKPNDSSKFNLYKAFELFSYHFTLIITIIYI